MALTDKNKLFADHYLVEINATEAAKKAGYSEKTAYSQGQRLLKNVEIRAYIDERQKKVSEGLEVDAKWVLNKLVMVVERSSQAEPVMKWDYGERKLVETGEYQYDSQGVNRALELIGKTKGMWTDNINLKGNVGVTILNDIPRDKK